MPSQLAEDRAERGLDLVRRSVAPDDGDELFLRDRAVTFAGEKRKGEPPLAAGEITLLDERLAVLDRDSTGEIDPHCRQAFANVPAMVRQ